MVERVRAAFPDMVFTVNLIIEKGDLVASNWTVHGTHTGEPFYDVPASGEPGTINGTAILRLRDRRSSSTGVARTVRKIAT